MTYGPARFVYYLNKLQDLLTLACKQRNPAQWLYHNDARTILFMLEGLSKLYSGLHNKKKFTKIKDHFKLLEDALGAIDYYDNMARVLEANKKMPPAIMAYLQAQTREKVQSLNEVLTEKKWLSANSERIKKIQKKLNEVDWLKEEEEVSAIKDFYGGCIYEITEFVQQDDFHFTNIEADVHELRRKLRWLSIYPQALQGCIQLGKNDAAPKQLNKYLTKEITTSPYNKMPETGDASCYLMLEQNYFYALSWMIATLGKIKDKGLNVIAVKEALEQTSAAGESGALKKAYQLLGPKQQKIEQLLKEADTVCKTFFTEHNLEHLVKGVINVSKGLKKRVPGIAKKLILPEA